MLEILMVLGFLWLLSLVYLCLEIGLGVTDRFIAWWHPDPEGGENV